MPDLAKVAFDDPSWRSNPRMPLVKELIELYWMAFRGRGSGETAAAVEPPIATEEALV
jgi:hypothetical protein